MTPVSKLKLAIVAFFKTVEEQQSWLLTEGWVVRRIELKKEEVS